MTNINSLSSIKIGELNKIKDFEEGYKNEAKDSDWFLALAEIEEL